MTLPKISLSVAATIVATGAVLNLASSGLMGEQVKKIADYIISGYGK